MEPLPNRQTEMPSLPALSARLSGYLRLINPRGAIVEAIRRPPAAEYPSASYVDAPEAEPRSF
jgi:hypothetical protein